MERPPSNNAALAAPPPSTPSASAPAAAPKDPNYKSIKTRYFQSLNLGKHRGPAPVSGGSATPGKKPTATAAMPIQRTHTRQRSNTQPAVFLSGPPSAAESMPSAGGGRPMPGTAPAGGSDYFVPFAMSVPAHMLLENAMAPSYMPRSLLDSRDTSLEDLDEDVIGRNHHADDDFEHSQPIAIPVGAAGAHSDDSRPLLDPNFVDHDANSIDKEQRRRAAKIRTLVSSEAE